MLKNIKVAAISDIHVGKDSIADATDHTFPSDADLLLIAGDITHRGLPRQTKEYLKKLRGLSIPIIAVLGNHDYDDSKETRITQLLEGGKVRVLSGEVVTFSVKGFNVGITGTKGHGGGFEPHRACARGEKSTKQYMQEEEEEVQKWKKGLSKMKQLDLDFSIGLLHYAPYRETIVGEPPELSIFMGSSRFADVLKQYPVDLVVHGHAHHGTGELIKTREGQFACNVAKMLHQETYALFSLEKTSQNEQSAVRILTPGSS